jgi:hypothetical protein
MKNLKKPYQAHTSRSKTGMGDYYGTGIKAKVGKNISSTMGNPVSDAKIKNPPKSLA